MKTKIITKEDGTKIYEKECAFCRRVFQTVKPSTKFCCEQHKEANAKRRKGKAKSGRKYHKKYEVERTLAGACRSLSRRIAMLTLPAIDQLTGETVSWEELQVHHIDGNCQNIALENLATLTAKSHAELHQRIKEEFDCDIDKLMIFGKSLENYDSSPIEAYEEIRDLRDRITKFQLGILQYRKSIPVPVFNQE